VGQSLLAGDLEGDDARLPMKTGTARKHWLTWRVPSKTLSHAGCVGVLLPAGVQVRCGGMVVNGEAVGHLVVALLGASSAGTRRSCLQVWWGCFAPCVAPAWFARAASTLLAPDLKSGCA